jgi:hypothetical protein
MQGLAVPERRVEGRQSTTKHDLCLQGEQNRRLQELQVHAKRWSSAHEFVGAEWRGEVRANLGLVDPFTATSSMHGQMFRPFNRLVSYQLHLKQLIRGR